MRRSASSPPSSASNYHNTRIKPLTDSLFPCNKGDIFIRHPMNTNVRPYLELGSVRIFHLRFLGWRFFLGLLLFSQTSCVGHLASRTTGTPGIAQEIKKSLASVRGLEFADGVEILVGKNDVVRKYLEDGLLREYGREKSQNLSLAYAKLGLWPSGTDVRSSLLRLYRAQVEGFYDPNAKKVILLEENRSDKTVLVHELTHALQDQHFRLGNRLGPSDNDDKTLALRSVAEGDAVLSEMAFRIGGADHWSMVRQDVDLEISSVETAPLFSKVPAAISDKLLFPYKTGVALVYRVFKNKGWPGVDFLYGSPPLATEQVLHPEKYLDVPDPPIRVDLEDLSSLFPSDWREIENNVLGELMVRCLFKEFLPPQEAEVVANGWGGDRFVAFRRGDEVSFIWATVWDSSKDADEFFQKYHVILSRKYSSPDSSNSLFFVEKRDRLVVVVEGLHRTHIKKNIDKILREIKLEKEPFKSPFSSPPVPAID